MVDDRILKLRKNKFLLFWCKFFFDLNVLQAILQLFYLQRGLNLSQIFYLSIAWALASLIFDVPTSFLADRWSRKKTMTLGVILNVLVNFSLFFVYGFVPFFINMFFLSLSYTFFTGVEDAFLYDTLKELKQEDVVLKTSGKYQIAARLSRMIPPLVGVIIASNLSAYQFDYLLAINLITSVFAIYFVMNLVEPTKDAILLKSKIIHFKSSIKMLLEDRVLRLIAFNKTLVFIASFAFARFYQIRLVDLGVSVLMLGFFYVFFNLIMIMVYSRSTFIFNKINKVLIFDSPVLIIFVGCLIFAFSQVAWIAYVTAILVIITGIIRDPFFNQQIQWRIKSDNRATISSIIGILKSILDIPIFLLLGFLANYGTFAIMLVPIIMGVVALLFFRIKKEDIILGPTK